MKKGFFEVGFEISCIECGTGLEVDITNNTISVGNCEKCIEKAYQEGKQDKPESEEE